MKKTFIYTEDENLSYGEMMTAELVIQDGKVVKSRNAIDNEVTLSSPVIEEDEDEIRIIFEKNSQ